jgi:ankyrin repeat protein
MQSGRPIHPFFIRSVLLILLAACSLLSYSQEQQGDTTLFYSLLSGPDAQTNINYALLTAAANGDTVQIWWLIRYGAEIETKTYEKITPLFYAVANEKIEAAKMLLSDGSDPNAITSFLETPLLVAVKNNYIDMAELLIRDSADIKYADRNGATCLHYAALLGYFYMADMLLYYDADISVKSFDGTTPLMAAVGTGNADIADIMLQNGAKTEDKDNNGFTPFLIAAQNGDTVMMDLLLKYGADMYVVNKFKYDALDICIKVNAAEACKYLLRKGDKWGENVKKPIGHGSVANIYRRADIIPVLKRYKLYSDSGIGFDEVIVSASIKNCILDYYTGISAAFKEPAYNFGFMAGIDFKPGYTRVLMKQDENTYYQYYDKGAVVYAGIFKDIPLTDNPFGGNWYFTGSVCGGYSFGNKLKGTDINPGDKFRFIPAAGFKWTKGTFSFDSGLEYMNTDFYKIGPLWLRLGFSWSFFFNNTRAPLKVIKWF